MTANTTQPRPPYYYAIARALLLPALLYYVVVLFFSLTLPQGVIASTHIEKSLLMRLLLGLVLAPADMIVGMLIMRRVPGNVIGPLMVLFGCAIPGMGTLDAFGGWLKVAIQLYNTGILFFVQIILIMAFPTGRIYPARWHVLATAFSGFTLVVAIVQVTSVPAINSANLPNPAYIPAMAGLESLVNEVYPFMILGSFLLPLFSLLARYRSAPELQRRQIRWLLWSFSSMLIFVLGWMVPANEDSLYSILLRVISTTWFAIVPAFGVGIAILRHRLYDIDIIIRRTLVYTILTAVLVIVYFGAVVLSQQLLRALTGQTSDIAIVISTLAVSALFAPLRNRIQTIIDRRLYRRKYDAEHALSTFGQVARSEVNLEQLSQAVVAVVQDTVQPSRISVWLLDPERREGMK